MRCWSGATQVGLRRDSVGDEPVSQELTSIGVDIGGTTIKAAVVVTSTGVTASDIISVATPTPATPQSVAIAIAGLVEELDHPGVIGCALPGVVRNLSLQRARNLASEWEDRNALETLTEVLGRSVVPLNDADAVGLGELSYGQRDHLGGLAVVLTFGTGIGSALLNQSALIQNTELGELTGSHGTFEEAASAAAIQRLGLSPRQWAHRAQPYFGELERLLSPELWVIGGGLTSEFDDYFTRVHTTASIRVACNGENAGVVGAARAVVERRSQPVK